MQFKSSILAHGIRYWIFMTILHISGHTAWGGSEQQLINTIDQLQSEDIHQKIFCFDNTPTKKAMENRNIKVLSIQKTKPHKSRYLKFLKSIIEKEQVDLIHLHTSDALTGYVLGDLMYSFNTKTIYSRKLIRNSTSFLSALKYNYSKIHGIICVSEYVKNHFSKTLSKSNQHKIRVIRDGVERSSKRPVDLPDFKMRDGLGNDIVLFGNLANHTKAKDLPTLIRAIAYLVHELGFSEFRLFQIGKHSKLTPSLIALAKELKVQDYIYFEGFIDNASSLIPEFDVFVMSSEREGGPSSVIEAFQHKTPVVSTNVGIVGEFMSNGENGFVNEVGDFKTMAENLKKLAQDANLRIKFANNGFDLYQENFTVERLGKETLQFYKDLLAGNFS